MLCSFVSNGLRLDLRGLPAITRSSSEGLISLIISFWQPDQAVYPFTPVDQTSAVLLCAFTFVVLLELVNLVSLELLSMYNQPFTHTPL